MRSIVGHSHPFLSAEGSMQVSGHDPSSGQPLMNRSSVWDDSETVLALAEHLASSKHQKAQSFAASLYQTIFRYNSSPRPSS